ncbi:DUF2335 domain-containing protein [Raoultella ornithinolytica]|uniref:DUF2335 domain-containing protein n=1 Tax=Raoultella ornithinolytica TaxID=54291 RepID=A0A9Q9JDR5_RAOOR|nr:DUF2335 domain-containing protein [Raoultella ornithinolytica]UXE39494.1 DUF2335 domain-containing protein [Raoultella ornithinolytica]
MQDCVSEKPNVNLLQQADEEDRSSEELAEEIEGELVENPAVLERLLERPQIKMLISQSSFRGPIPPPAMLREYNEIVKDGAEQIMTRSEKEQAHRHGLQNKTVTGNIDKDKRGQWMAFIITVLILVIATIFAWKGNTVFAGTLITIDLIGLASVFIMGRTSSPQRKPKNDEED